MKSNEHIRVSRWVLENLAQVLSHFPRFWRLPLLIWVGKRLALIFTFLFSNNNGTEFTRRLWILNTAVYLRHTSSVTKTTLTIILNIQSTTTWGRILTSKIMDGNIQMRALMSQAFALCYWDQSSFWCFTFFPSSFKIKRISIYKLLLPGGWEWYCRCLTADCFHVTVYHQCTELVPGFVLGGWVHLPTC